MKKARRGVHAGLVLGASIAIAILAGCHHRESGIARLRNPARGGDLDGSQIILGNYPPDEAAILQYSSDEICFGIKLRGGEDEVQLDTWEVSLELDRGEDLREPRLEHLTTTTEGWGVTRGHDVSTTEQGVCDVRREGEQCSRRYQTRYERNSTSFRAAQWMACFTHHGVISGETRSLRLLLSPPRGSVLSFEWQLH